MKKNHLWGYSICHIIPYQKTLRIMKLSTLLMTVLTVNIMASGYSQENRFDLAFKDQSVREILKAIENRSEFRFFYNDEFTDLEKKVSFNAEDQSIEELLYILLYNTEVSYKILENNFVVLTPKNLSQQQSISGTVTDGTTGELLVGVTIQVKGTMTGSISQSDGSYSVNIPHDANVLIFSFVGYVTQEIPINGRTVIDVVMEEEITALEEIVVTGYSVEKKKDIIGSVSVVNTEEMLSRPSGNITGQLVGRVAGITVSSDGSVDGDSKIRVRGFGSFAGSDPLYIIDGVPGDVDNLNPNDIESVQVLKDAASASVYGARAANGVMIITTKQGQAGRLNVAFNAYYGVNYISKNDFPELCDAQQWGELYFSQMAGGGRNPGDLDWQHPQYGSGPTPVIPEYILANVGGSRTGGAELEELRISDPAMFDFYTNPENYDFATHQIVKSGNTDWFDEVYNPAPITNINLSATGGSEKGTFALGLNYFNQNSTSSKYEYYTRYSLRANTAFNLMDFLVLGENMQVSYVDGRNIGGNVTGAAWTMPALLPVYDIMGNPASSAARGICDTNDGGLGTNPIGTAWRNRFDGYYTWGIFGNAFMDIKPIKDLVIRSSFGIDYRANQSKNMTQVTYEHSENTNPPNNLTWSWNNGISWTWTNTITYSKTLGLHSLKILVGSEAINSRNENISATRSEIEIDDDPWYLVIDSGTGEQTNSGTYSTFRLLSYFGRLDYTFADKYIFNATIRRDGSSKFGENNRFGYFPAVGLGWRISGESFMNNLTWLTDLKLRGSYGIIGNQSGLANENQFSTFEKDLQQTYPISGSNNEIENSYTKARLGNPDAKWEKTITTNVGFDATLFSGGLTVNFDYFIKKTEDLLVTQQAPYTAANVTQPSINIGNIKNSGVDIAIGRRGNIIGQIDYDVNLNFSAYKNIVLKVLDNPDAVLYGGNTRLGYVTITRQDDPISTFYGYQTEGFFNTEDEVNDYIAVTNNTWLPPEIGRWKIKDVNNDDIINDNDRTFIGSPHPDFQVSLSLSLAYRNFDLNTQLFWSQGGDLFNYTRYQIDFNTYAHNRSLRMLNESWTPELGNNAKLPKHDINDNFSNKYATDYYVEDATYIRLMNLQLGYNLPESILNIFKIDRLRIYVQGQNLFTWKKEFSGLDPGRSISGGDLSMGVVNSYAPTPKQFLVGIDFQF